MVSEFWILVDGMGERCLERIEMFYGRHPYFDELVADLPLDPFRIPPDGLDHTDPNDRRGMF